MEHGDVRLYTANLKYNIKIQIYNYEQKKLDDLPKKKMNISNASVFLKKDSNVLMLALSPNLPTYLVSTLKIRWATFWIGVYLLLSSEPE